MKPQGKTVPEALKNCLNNKGRIQQLQAKRGCKIAGGSPLALQRLRLLDHCATRGGPGFHCRGLGDLEN